MEIIEINNVGIGYGLKNNKKVFVEKTAIGDVVENDKIIENKKNRQDVKCSYYNECGGCNLLHLSDYEYYKFKEKLCKTDNIIKIGLGTRRRINLKVKNGKIGYCKTKSNEFVAIKECLIATENINKIIKLWTD